MRRDAEGGELAWCRDNGVGVIAYGPLAHGLLTGKMSAETTFAAGDWRAESEFFADDAFPERIAVARELDDLARGAGREGGVAELAVAWVLRRPEVTSAIVGARTAQQAVGNPAAVGRRGGGDRGRPRPPPRSVAPLRTRRAAEPIPGCVRSGRAAVCGRASALGG
jgi:aryl-alcohol dehydrogenase-like predicted oxidoreductase